MNILVVDDNPHDRLLAVHQILAQFPDANITELHDRAGLENAVTQPLDLVVTDLHLRWGTGLDVLREVKQLHPECPVVMFTGTGDEETAVEAMKSGLDDYVLKQPGKAARLGKAVRDAVSSAHGRVELRRTRKDLQKALEQKDRLLAELAHRVKNNLQTVISLLRLRARRIRDKTLRAEYEDLAGRIEALAAVQARLDPENVRGIVDFPGFLQDLVTSFQAQNCDTNIAIDYSADEGCRLALEEASPLGLLVYEAVLNAVKHAYPDGRSGTVTLKVQCGKEHVRIAVEDDGVGFKTGAAGPGTMGINLMRGLADQAGAQLSLDSRPNGGTRILVSVPRRD